MTLLGLFPALLIPLILGVVLLSALERKHPLFQGGEKLAVGFVLGSGILTLYIFLLGLAGVRFTFWSCSGIFWPFLGLGIREIARKKTLLRFSPPALFRGIKAAGKIAISLLLLLLAFKLAFIAFNVVVNPTYFDDSVSIWNYKAKVFYYNRGLVRDIQSPDFFGGRTPKYPNGIPLLKTWIALCLGKWEEGAVNIINLVIFVCTGIIIYSNLKRYSPPWFALITAYLALSLPLFAFHAGFVYVDLIVGFYFLGGVVYFYRWFLERDLSLVVVSALFFTIGAWIKDEGLYLLGGAILPTLILYLIIDPGMRKAVLRASGLLVLVVVVLISPWLVCKQIFSFPLAVVGKEYLKIEFHPEAFLLCKNFFLGTGNYNLFWLFYLFSIPIFLLLKDKKGTGFLVISNIFALVVVLAPFVFTPLFEWLAPGTTINRAVLTVIPAMFFSIGRIWGLWLEEGKVI